MKKLITTLAIISAPSSAMAHPGDHQFDLLNSLQHILTQPDHAAAMALVVIACIILWKTARRRSA